MSKFYFSIVGSKQGQFKGEVGGTQHKNQMRGVGFNYGITVPRDPTTGQPSGKRRHEPVQIIKEWGAASPQILTALVTNESLKTVLLEFVRESPKGIERVFHTIKLTNATVADVQQYVQAPESTMELERVSFTFQKIEIENKDGDTIFSDSWGQ
jgi:type VI secretion system secreted protein Hcp